MVPLGTAILTPELSAKQGKKGVSIGPYRGPFGPLYKPYTPIALRKQQTKKNIHVRNGTRMYIFDDIRVLFSLCLALISL